MSFRLRESVASKDQGRDLWFAQMTGIGPMTTPDPEEAAEFTSAEAARACPAYSFPLTVFEVVEITK